MCWMAFGVGLIYILTTWHLRHTSAFLALSPCVFPLHFPCITIPSGLDVY